MTDLQDAIANTSVKAFNSGYLKGAWDERERITAKITAVLERYYELSQEPDEEGNVTDNPEWDAGFRAAMALIKGMQND